MDHWEDDTLKRIQDASYLTDYLDRRYQKRPKEMGFVLAIDAEWGFGKTFLIDRWHKDLKDNQYPTILFDAWKNDFSKDPLIAFISELNESLAPYFKEVPTGKVIFDDAINTLKKILLPTAKAIGFSIFKQATGMAVGSFLDQISSDDQDNDSDKKISEKFNFEDAQKKLSETIEGAIKNHQTVKNSIALFRMQMSRLVEAIESSSLKLPIIIFVDELDRCRPNYALELLETIKHIFGVPGVYFVISTNILQLSHSVKAVYGAEFNGHRYLKRFFDLEYSLPAPDERLFVMELFKSIEFPININHGLSSTSNYSDDPITKSFLVYAKYFGLTLRDMEQAVRIIENCLVYLTSNIVHIQFLFYLAVVYQRSPPTYRKIVAARGLTIEINIEKIIENTESAFYIPNEVDMFTIKKGKPRKVSIDSVISIYFNLIKGPRETSFPTDADFPNNLACDLYNAVRSNQADEKFLDTYLFIVQHAGSHKVGG